MTADNTRAAPIRAMLFDMDGVVIDSHDSVTVYWQKLAAQHGITISPEQFTRHIYGNPFEHTLDHVFPQLDADQRRAAADLLYEYENNQLQYIPMPGVIALLRALRGRVPVGLVTSGDRAKTGTVFRQLALDALFDVRVTMEDVAQGKPDPAPYRLGAARVGVPPEHCLVFEDSRNGVRAAVGAGCRVVGVQPPEHAPPLRDLGAVGVIADFCGAAVDDGALVLPGELRFALA